MSKDIAVFPKKCKEYYGADADGNRGMWIKWFECPECGEELEYEQDKCNNIRCGQSIDWSEPEII